MPLMPLSKPRDDAQVEARANVALREIEIVLVSLQGAEARRRLMRAQLEVPGMPPYSIVDGVDGRRLDATQLAETYDDAAALRQRGLGLTPGEIGCAASHLAVYRHIANHHIPVAVVLEDDALLGHKFLNVLDRLLGIVDPARAEAILLSYVVRYSAWGARRVDKTHSLYRPYEAYGAHAYLITLAGAQSMLSAFERVRTVGDDWLYFMKAGIIDVTALVPYLIGTSPFSRQSQIGERLPASPPPMADWLRKYLWQNFLFQLVVKPALRLRKQQETW
jgi:glycosyl transferase family 25